MYELALSESLLPTKRRSEPSRLNAAAVYLAGLKSANSRRSMERPLRVIAEIVAPGVAFDALPWHDLRYEHTQAIQARLAERYDAATVNHAISALRGTLKTAWRLGQMGVEDYMRACDLKPVKGEKIDQAAGRAVEEWEIRALIAACKDDTPAGARDAALFGLAYAGGLRRAELAALNLEDVNLESGVVKVHGKGNKERTVHIHNGALRALKDWIAIRGDAPGALLWAVQKGGKLVPGRMSNQAIYNIMGYRAKQAKLKSFSPHDMRRTFAGDMLDAGVDIATVQKMMGHANVSTTAGYDRRGERAKADAAKKIHFPY